MASYREGLIWNYKTYFKLSIKKIKELHCPSVCLSICAIVKHPVPAVAATSGWRTCSWYWPVIKHLFEFIVIVFFVFFYSRFWTSLLLIVGELAGEGLWLLAVGCLHFNGTSMALQRHIICTSMALWWHFRGTSTTLPRHFNDTSTTLLRHFHGTSTTLQRHLNSKKIGIFFLLFALIERFSISLMRYFCYLLWW